MGITVIKQKSVLHLKSVNLWTGEGGKKTTKQAQNPKQPLTTMTKKKINLQAYRKIDALSFTVSSVDKELNSQALWHSFSKP